MAAWSACKAELLGYLQHRVGRFEDAEELLQEVFIKAMGQGCAFCGIDQPRAWLFQVARNALVDRLRQTQQFVSLPEDLAAPSDEVQDPVDKLSQCLPRVLAELLPADRLAIVFCDIEGHAQHELAERLGLTLPGAKSRLQRARRRLKQRLESGCQVHFDENGAVCCFTPRPGINVETGAALGAGLADEQS